MFNPDGCFCCEPPEDPCVLSGCTWSSTEMSDADLTSGVTYHNPASGSTPDGTYEVTNIQDTSTGNDAPCRKITIETAVAPSKSESVYAICWKDGATHTPSAQCPLTNVSFCVESKRHGDSDSGLTDGVVFVVRQNGKIYATATQSVGVNWKRASGTYTSSQFTWVNGSGSPDFSATGTAIEFGFALKLAVPRNGEPYDVVLFDNLCVSRTPACGLCNDGNCDVLANDGFTVSTTEERPNTGNPGAINGTYTFTSSTTPIGNPAHGILLFWDFNNTPECVLYALVDTGIAYTPTGCWSPSSVAICTESKIEVGSGPIFYGFENTIVQNGNHYATSLYNLINGYRTYSDWGKISSAGSASQYKKIQFSANGLPQLVSGSPDFTQPFTVGVAAGVSSIWRNPLTQIVSRDYFKVYVDNVCVNITYGSCPKWDYAATVSGVTLTPKVGFGCNSTWVSQAETNINSTLVLRRVTASSGCVFAYSGSVGTIPGRVDYSISFALSGWNGTQFTTGALRVLAGSGGNNMPANYTLAAPFDPCTETGTFNFVSTNGAAACLILSASGSITVVKI